MALILEINSHLAAADVESIPFKGPVLSSYLYGDPGLRRSVDIDLLVRKRDIGRATVSLAQLGYHWTKPFTDQYVRRFVRDNCEMELVSAGGDVIDLGWAITPRYSSIDLPMADVFRRTTSMDIAGERLLTMSLEDLYLALALHAGKHTWERLAWIVDLARLAAASPELDWPLLSERATQLGAHRLLLLAVCLSELAMGVPIPAELRVEFERDLTAKRLGEELAEALDRVLLVTSPELDDSLNVAQLRMRERPWDRLRYVARIAFTPTSRDWEIVTLPSGLMPLYYPLRMGRLAAKYLSRFVHR
jgi:hypothetical protein